MPVVPRASPERSSFGAHETISLGIVTFGPELEPLNVWTDALSVASSPELRNHSCVTVLTGMVPHMRVLLQPGLAMALHTKQNWI